MKLWVETLAVALSLAATGLLGGFTSKAVRSWGWNPAWSYLTTPITATVWAWQVKFGKMPLAKASALYDVALALSWFAGFAIFGEVITARQWAGVLLLTLGLVLVNA